MPEPTHAHPNSPNPIRTHPNLILTHSRYGDRHPFGTRAPSTMLSTCVAAWNWPSWVGTIPASLLLIVLYVAKRDWSPTIAFYIGRASEIESKRQPNKAQRSPTVSFFIGRASQIGSPTKPNEAQQSHFSVAGLVNASPMATQRCPTTARFIGRAHQIGSPT